MMLLRNHFARWVLGGLLLAPLCTQGADHLDAPLLRAPGVGARDINDVYAFQSPANPANTVLVMTVNPFAGMVNPFGTISPTTFGSDVNYQFNIDNNGDALADVTYNATFGAAGAGGIQSFVATKTTGSGTNNIASGSTETNVAVSGGGLVRAGLFDDPFFFDLVGFNSGFAFTGSDTFAGANISAIVLEVPSTELGASNIGVWASTFIGGVQQDRKGRPAINTAVISSGNKDAFNAGVPSTDVANFSANVRANILALSNAANADALTPILLPDLLTIDTSSAAGFLNGRALANDVIDAELNLLSAGAVTGDGVIANDRAFLNVFPYLAGPNQIPEPSSVVLIGIGLLATRRLVRRRVG